MTVRMVAPNGIITTIAGDRIIGFSGDGGPATAAELHDPSYINLDACGNIIIPDLNNDRVRKVSWFRCDYLSVLEVVPQTLKLSIYPNPVTTTLTITNIPQQSAYQLHTIIGSVVQQGILNTGSTTIPVGNLPPGMYVLEVTGEDGEKVARKVVKE